VRVPGEAGNGLAQVTLSFPGLKAGLIGAATYEIPLAPEPTERACLRGHTNAVQALAITPDGKTLVSGSKDRTLKLWDLTTGKEWATLQGHRGFVESVAISADGKTLASGGHDTQIKLWHLAAGRELLPLEGQPSRIGALAFSPDGKLLASGGYDQTVRLWDLGTHKQRGVLSGHGGAVLGLAFSPDGKLLAAGSNRGTVTLWDVASGTERVVLTQNDNVSAVAFSPDGKTLAAGGNYRGVRLWEVATGLERARLVGQTPRVISLALAAEGRLLAASGHGGIVELWDLTTGKAVAWLRADADFIRAVVFAPDGKTMAVAEGPDTTIRLWDVSVLRPGPAGPAARLSDKQFEELWADLAGTDAARAYLAIWSLTAVAPQAVPWLKERLRPVATGDPRHLAKLITDLASDHFAIREKAWRELEKLGESAGPALQKALSEQPSAEARRRVERLQERLQRPAASPERLRVLRAIEVLEHIATPEGRQVLEQLADGMPAAPVTQEARRSLERLVQRAVQPSTAGGNSRLRRDYVRGQLKSPHEQLLRIRGKVKVLDANTLVFEDGTEIEVGGGMDAPDLAQQGLIGETLFPCGKEAAEFLRKLIGDQTVTFLAFTDQEPGARRLRGRCLVGEMSPEIEMVRNGWAVADHTGTTGWEIIARENHRGLWRGQFIVPRRWRAGERLPGEAKK
jgi:WD40 repeat protein/endonuclease YncB( thermonuclease family)